ncbi:MAG: hypothetical protein ACXWSC_17020, partial [Bdellovibrionota bacterium]
MDFTKRSKSLLFEKQSFFPAGPRARVGKSFTEPRRIRRFLSIAILRNPAEPGIRNMGISIPILFHRLAIALAKAEIL